jgi:hypothetical protein
VPLDRSPDRTLTVYAAWCDRMSGGGLIDVPVRRAVTGRLQGRDRLVVGRRREVAEGPASRSRGTSSPGQLVVSSAGMTLLPGTPNGAA